jgi:hypothetical protein
MAILKDKEEEKGQGTSGVLGQAAPEQQQGMPQEQQPSGPANIGGSSATQTSAPVKAMPKQQKAGTGTFANLKSYLQAAQGGGQQRVAQAAAGQVQRLGAGAQKATQQAQKTFGTQMQAGSLAGMETAGQEAADIVKGARATTYQAPQQAQVQTQSATQEGAEAPVQAPTTPAQPQQYFTPEQTQRFAEIINAQYQGPQSLQQAGLYDPAAQKARTAQQAGQLTQTALGREQLLRDVFGRGRDYSRGVSKLDALLLNASQQGVQQLQEQAQPALQAQQALQAAQNLSTNEAAQRKTAIEQIRAGARGELVGARTQEEQAVEKRIDDLTKTPAIQKDAEGKPILDEAGNPKYIQKLDQYGKPAVDAGGNPVFQTEWDRLPEHFRQSLATKVKPQWELSAEEAAVLGVGAGEGLYNIRPEDIQTAKAERDRLVTKDELSRQLALSQLAGTDLSRELQKDLLYTDLEKAGTQNLASSLDVDSFRKLLNESQKKFKESAEGTTLTGTGKKTVSRGNISGTKKKTYYAQQQGNVADMLRQAGYDVSNLDPSEAKSLLSNKDLLNRYLGATSTSRDQEGSNLDQVARDYAAQAALASNPITAPLAALKSMDTVQGLLEELGLGGVSEGISDVRNVAASPFTGIGNIAGNNVVGDIFKGVGGAIGGIDAGEMKSHGTGKAKQIAIKDLQKKYEDYLRSQGFENRTNIADTETTRARSQALQDLLRRQG